MKNTESKIADTILQEPSIIKVGERSYKMPSLTMATLLKASKEISKIPVLENGVTNLLGDSFFMAKYAKNVAAAFSIFLLGSKGYTLKLFGLKIYEFKDKSVRELSNYILENVDLQSLHKMATETIGQLDVSFFLGIITTLNEINLTKKTRETEMTPSGQ